MLPRYAQGVWLYQRIAVNSLQDGARETQTSTYGKPEQCTWYANVKQYVMLCAPPVGNDLWQLPKRDGDLADAQR